MSDAQQGEKGQGAVQRCVERGNQLALKQKSQRWTV